MNTNKNYQKLQGNGGLKIKGIKPVGRREVYDISVADAEHYLLENGVVSHNTGLYYSSSNIWIIGRQQDKVGTEIQGYHFVINVEKSRYVKEKSKIPISVSWDGGVSKYSGICDIAIESGFIKKNGQFIQLLNIRTGELEEKKVREKNIPGSYWAEFVQYKPFADFIIDKYKIGQIQMISEIESDISEDESDD
jgi:formylmethanofuran dehydrogenase subunit C